MNCMSCGAPIRPEFKASIRTNICPACGKELMNEATLDLLADIKEALEKMPNDPEGIAGWLLANYEMRKVGSGEPVSQFFPPSNNFQNPRANVGHNMVTQLGPNATLAEKEAFLRANPVTRSTPLDRFYQNAGVRPKNYKEIMNKIQSGEGEADYGDGEVEEALDPEFTKAALSAMEGTAMPESNEDFAALRNMIHNMPTASEEGIDGNSFADEQRRLRLEKQEQLMNSGSVGLIKRSR